MQKKDVIFCLFVLVVHTPYSISSQEEIDKLIADTFYVYQSILERTTGINQKKEVYDVCTEGVTFFSELLYEMSQNGLPDCLNSDITDFDNPMINDNPYKNTYGYVKYSFTTLMEKIRPSRKESLFLHTTLPFQQEYILDSYNKLLLLISTSPHLADCTLLHLLDTYNSFESFYKEHIQQEHNAHNELINHQVGRQKTTLFSKWFRCLKFFVLPVM